MPKAKASNPKPTAPPDEVEAGVVGVFAEAVRILGLPPSVGSIYGVFFASSLPLSMDDVVKRLGISKGSASQGLRLLRQFGALRPVTHGSGRREYYVANTELRKVVGGFLRTELLPQMEKGVRATNRLAVLAEAHPDPARRKTLVERLAKLAAWQRRGQQVLSLVERFLD